MPRSRVSEMPQRQFARLKTSTSDSDPPQPHHRPIKDRSPKLAERRSPRSAPLSDTVNQKKLGTRISDLESQLGQAQIELKSLKDQLVSAETARKEAQEELERKKKTNNNNKVVLLAVPNAVGQEVCKSSDSDVFEVANAAGQEECKSSDSDVFEVPVESQQETDVFEVQVENTTTMKPKLEEDLGMKKDEIDINTLTTKLEDKEQELIVFVLENESLKDKLSESVVKLSEVEEELKVSKTTSALLREKLEVVEGSKEALEVEMKKLRVQTEQWRKAADAAAAILSGGVEMSGGRISERCGSMDNKHFGGGGGGEYSGFVVSPVMMVDELDDGFGSSGKRKSSGIKKLGDLWKKKGQK